MIDKLVLINKQKLIVVFTTRNPVLITAPDALALWLHINRPVRALTLVEFTKALTNEMEATCPGFTVSKAA